MLEQIGGNAVAYTLHRQGACRACNVETVHQSTRASPAVSKVISPTSQR